MYNVLKKQKLAKDIYLIQIEAPDVARNARPGQFVIVQLHEKGERIPLSIADYDRKSITMVFGAVGKTTKELASLKKGNTIPHFMGPLGNPTEIKQFGTVCLIGGGFGAAPLYPIAKEMKKAKNKVLVIMGAKSKNLLFWNDMMEKVSDRLMITTDDGSKGDEGLVTKALEKALRKIRMDRVITVGPLPMMKAVCRLTKHRAKTIVSLNPIMMDGIGMCGGCRVIVGNESRFACVDGPEFDGHKVDWDSISTRNQMYKKEEKHVCKCGR